MGGAGILFVSYFIDIALTVSEVAGPIIAEVGGGLVADAATFVGEAALESTEIGESLVTALESPLGKIVEGVEKYGSTLLNYANKADKAYKEYEKFVKAKDEVKDAFGDMCDDAEKGAEAMKMLMGQALQLRKVVQDVHDCNLSSAERNLQRVKVKSVKSAFENMNIGGSNEERMKKKSKDIGSLMLRHGMRKIFGANLGGCFDAIEGTADFVEKSNTLFSSLKDKKHAKDFFAAQSQDFQCATHNNGGTSHFKCPANVDSQRNTVLNDDYCENNRRRELNDNIDPSESSVNITTTGYKWTIPYPVEYLCGEQGFIKVKNFDEANRCSIATISGVTIDYSHSEPWNSVLGRGSCKTVLFAASEDPADEYCTIGKAAKTTKAKYVKNPHGGDRGYYNEMPYCESIEQFTTSSLAAMSNVRPEFGLISFVYAPNGELCSDTVGTHRVVVDGTSMMLPATTLSNTTAQSTHMKTTEEKSDNTMVIAILVIVSVQLVISLMKSLKSVVGSQGKTKYHTENGKNDPEQNFEDMPH